MATADEPFVIWIHTNSSEKVKEIESYIHSAFVRRDDHQI